MARTRTRRASLPGRRGPAAAARAAMVAAAVAVAVAFVTGCGAAGGGPVEVDEAEQVSLTGDERAIKVGVLRQPHLSHALFYGRYLPDNVTVEVVPFANSTEIKNAVVSGDLALGVTGITAAMQGAATGEPVVVVAAAADGASAIVAGADAGIATVADLRGKRIGYVPGSAQDILLRLTLLDAGLDPTTDVELLNVQFADMPAALARNDIDAFSGAETGPSDALVQGGAVLVTHPYDTAMAKINIVLVTSQELLDSDPDLVQAMVEVHAKATDYMRENVPAWIDEVSSKYGFSEAALELAVENIDLRWHLDDAYLAQVQVLGQEQVKLDQIQVEPDYQSFVTTTFVDALPAPAAAGGGQP